MGIKAKVEEFIYDIFKLAIVEVCFKHVEMGKLGLISTIVIAVLIALKHRGQFVAAKKG
jgi:hypothetical protein